MIDNLAINQILILLLQCFIVASLILFFFRLRTIFGLGLFYIAIGLFKFMHYFFTQAFSLEIASGIHIFIGPTVITPAILFSLLLIYIREDAGEVRKIIYAMIFFNFFFAIMLRISALGINGAGFVNILNLPEHFFRMDIGSLIAGSLGLFIDGIVLIVLYEFISKKISSIFLRIFLTMTSVLFLHALIFNSVAFIFKPLDTSLLQGFAISILISKAIPISVYTVTFWLYIIYFERWDANSKLTGSSFRDVFNLLTYRQKYEQVFEEKETTKMELQKSEIINKTLIEQLPQRIFVKDLNSVYLSCNQNYATDLGSTPNDIIGKNDFDYFPTDLAKAYREGDKEVMLKGETKKIEERYLLKGEERWIRTIKVPYRDSETHIIGILSVAEDITERKQAEEKLKAFNQQLQASQQQLRASNEQLVASNQQLQASEQQLRATNQQLQTTDLQLRAAYQELIASEKTLKESKWCYDQATSMAQLGYWTWDAATNKLFWSEQIFNIFGLDSKVHQPSAKKWDEIIHPDDRISVTHQFERSMTVGEPYDVKFRIVKPSGEEGFVRAILNVSFSADGEPLSAIGMLQDITKSKQAKEALEKSEKFSKDVIDSMLDGFSILDKDGVHLDVNKSFSKMTGYNKEELIGVGPPHPYWPEEEFENIRVAFEKTAQGLFEDFELVFKKKNGERFPVIVSPSELKDDKGNVIASYASIKNITERKMAEEKIKAGEAHVAAILNSLPASICVIDETGKILQVNDVWKEFGTSGRPEEKRVDYAEYNYFDVCKADSKNEYSKVILKGLKALFKEQTGVFDYEYPCHTPDKEQWFLLRADVMKTKQKEIVISHFDVTNRIKIQKELVAALAEITELKQHVEAENIYLKEELHLEGSFEEIIGSSITLKKVLKQVEQVAKSDTTVMILGETGTGKELLAKAIHGASHRKNKSLVKVNCSALPAELIESELFGHEKGAFTGAINKKIGRFELANHGTIFLDEIGDLPINLQTRLLRVLQENEFERVGGEKTIQVDVRIIAATNRNLEELVIEGEFRQDLYYRLNVFPVTSPPLRDRKEDIPSLVSYFIHKYGNKVKRTIKSVHKESLDRLMAYDWPGNIRELEHVIERAIVLNQGEQLRIGKWFVNARIESNDTLITMEQTERDHIMKVLNITNGKIRGANGAAEILGLKPTTLESRMKKLNISRKK